MCVSSAMSGVTNDLVKKSRRLVIILLKQNMTVLVSSGEQVLVL